MFGDAAAVRETVGGRNVQRQRCDEARTLTGIDLIRFAVAHLLDVGDGDALPATGRQKLEDRLTAVSGRRREVTVEGRRIVFIDGEADQVVGVGLPVDDRHQRAPGHLQRPVWGAVEVDEKGAVALDALERAEERVGLVGRDVDEPAGRLQLRPQHLLGILNELRAARFEGARPHRDHRQAGEHSGGIGVLRSYVQVDGVPTGDEIEALRGGGLGRPRRSRAEQERG